jgi:molybdopterin adenylyltransferase
MGETPIRRAAVIVASDSRSDGTRVDQTGPAAERALAELGIETASIAVVPDDIAALSAAIRRWAAEPGIALILTAGGTGLSPRDVTPEATLAVIERTVPGIPELLRQQSLRVTPKAALGRGVAGIVNRTLVINLPGSPRAVTETIGFLAPILPHAIETLLGEAVECGRISR